MVHFYLTVWESGATISRPVTSCNQHNGAMLLQVTWSYETCPFGYDAASTRQGAPPGDGSRVLLDLGREIARCDQFIHRHPELTAPCGDSYGSLPAQNTRSAAPFLPCPSSAPYRPPPVHHRPPADHAFRPRWLRQDGALDRFCKHGSATTGLLVHARSV